MFFSKDVSSIAKSPQKISMLIISVAKNGASTNNPGNSFTVPSVSLGGVLFGLFFFCLIGTEAYYFSGLVLGWLIWGVKTRTICHLPGQKQPAFTPKNRRCGDTTQQATKQRSAGFCPPAAHRCYVYIVGGRLPPRLLSCARLPSQCLRWARKTVPQSFSF